jgi:hypothetical protein
VARVVVTTPDCEAFVGPLRSFEVEAADVRSLIRALDQRFPGLGEFMQDRVALAIDGEIQPVWTGPLRPDSEVALIPKLGGG